MMARLLLFSCMVLASACLPAPAERCRTDDECDGAVCSRDGECALAGTLVAVRLSWTLCAAPVTPERCQASDLSLRVTFVDDDTGENVLYEPVLCELGQIYFDRMSPRFDAVEASIMTDSCVLDSARFSLQGPESVFEIDFAPQSPTDPSWCAMLRAP